MVYGVFIMIPSKEAEIFDPHACLTRMLINHVILHLFDLK
jgi:hypothetical protein